MDLDRVGPERRDRSEDIRDGTTAFSSAVVVVAVVAVRAEDLEYADDDAVES